MGVIFGDFNGTFGELQFAIRQSVFRYGHFLNVRKKDSPLLDCEKSRSAPPPPGRQLTPACFRLAPALLQVLFSFLLVCVTMYFLIVLPFNSLTKAYFPKRKTRECPECLRCDAKECQAS